MTMNFAAIADHYYLMECEIASTADFLNTCLRESGLSANQVEITDLKPGIDALYLRLVAGRAEYDALKAVEAAARDYVQWQRPADSHCVECAQPKDACESGRNCSSGLFRAALAALDAIRKEVAR